MSSTTKKHLWIPGSGIKFAPSMPSLSLYPQLDFARFLQTPAPSSVNHELNAAETRRSQVAPEQERVDESQVASTSAADVVPASEGVNSESVTTLVVPPITPLRYNISEDLFFKARQATKDSSESFWSHLLYQSQGPDSAAQNVKVHYCTSHHKTEEVCKKYFLGEKILGFDMEWLAYATKASGPRANVSLIQIASPSRVGLFHVALFPQKDKLVSPTLRAILEDSGVSKVGVNIQADCTRLKNNLGVQTQGIFELSHLYKLVKYSELKRTELINKKRVALAVQVQEILGLPLYKGDNVRSSNWTQPLTSRQINYSATDAYAGLHLYYVLEGRREQLEPTPPRPHFSERGLPIEYIVPEPDTPEPNKPVNDAVEVATSIAPSAAAEAALETQTTPQSNESFPIRDHRIKAADARLQQYRDAAKSIKATPASLRAYYIWYFNNDLNPEAIAKLLRNPPLKTNTVTGYILKAVNAENLPYSRSRMKDEILATIPEDVLNGTFRSLAEACRQA
jgi:hypothetical protein